MGLSQMGHHRIEGSPRGVREHVMGASEWVGVAAMILVLMLGAGGLAMQLGGLKNCVKDLVSKVSNLEKLMSELPCILHSERLRRIGETVEEHGKRITVLEAKECKRP